MINDISITHWAQRHGVSPAALRELTEILCPDIAIPDPEKYDNEAQVQAQIRKASAYAKCWLGRNNNGAMEKDGRWIRFGLANDSKQTNERFKSGDLIGITPRLVMPEHIGQVWGIFTCAEVKEPGWKFTPGDKRAIAQLAFNNHVIRYGGIAGFCTSVVDYLKLIEGNV